MGTQTAQGTTERQTAIRWMLRDLQALEHMLAERMFETDITRIGAEQEMFLVDGSWQPSPAPWRSSPTSPTATSRPRSGRSTSS